MQKRHSNRNTCARNAINDYLMGPPWNWRGLLDFKRLIFFHASSYLKKCDYLERFVLTTLTNKLYLWLIQYGNVPKKTQRFYKSYLKLINNLTVQVLSCLPRFTCMSEAIKSIFQGCFEPETRANNNFSKECFSGWMRLYGKCRVRVDNNRVWPVMTKQGIKSKLKVWYDQENSHPSSQCYGI